MLPDYTRLPGETAGTLKQFQDYVQNIAGTGTAGTTGSMSMGDV